MDNNEETSLTPGNNIGVENSSMISTEESSSVENTCEKLTVTDENGEILHRLYASIDYITMTFPEKDNYDELAAIDFLNCIGITTLSLDSIDTGKNGYLYGIKNDVGLSYSWGTPDKALNSMGSCLIIPGKACRKLEQDGLDWDVFLNTALAFDGKSTRLDIALDDFNEILDLEGVEWYLNHGFVTSRFQKYGIIGQRKTTDGSLLGKTINFGSRQSEAYIRLYDKKLEQENDKKKLVEVESWQRYEVELKQKQA